MLTHDPDSTPAERYQYLLYQLKVWNKLFVQINRLKDTNPEKYKKAIDILQDYGYILSQDYELELEKDLDLAIIFEKAKDFIG